MLTQSLSGPWQFREQGQDAWLPATVPGGVHTDLLALDLIPDPFVGDNERQVAWVAERDWEYRRSFHVPAELRDQERLFLVCDGLDTLATVSLNGQVLGETANMFRQFRWDVTGRLVEGDNELVIAFRSPVRYCAAQDGRRLLPTVSQALPGGPHLRKAPCHFGWDWGPQLPPIGIWRDLRLEAASTARLEDVHVRQEHGDEVAIRRRLERGAVGRRPAGRDGGRAAAGRRRVRPPGTPSTGQRAALRAAHPRPAALVAQRLRRPAAVSSRGAAPSGRTVPKRCWTAGRCQVGLRTVELRREDDEWGSPSPSW